MRSVVPGDLFSSNIMHPGFGLLSSEASDLQLCILWFDVDHVEQIAVVEVLVAVVLLVFDLTPVGRWRSNDLGAFFLHCEQCVHAIWGKQTCTMKIKTRKTTK